MANATERAIRRKKKRAAAAAATKPRPASGFKRKSSDRGRRKVASAVNPNRTPLGDNAVLEAKGIKVDNAVGRKKKKQEKVEDEQGGGSGVARKEETFLLSTLPVDQQLRFFVGRFQSACGFKLSSLELEAFKDTCMVKLVRSLEQDTKNFYQHVKGQFGSSWKETLCKGNIVEGEVAPGSPAMLILSASAIRSLELLRALKKLTRDCRPAKLFAKHMKVEEQVAFLRSRVNIASGTPSRIKKLIDLDALGLSRLEMIVIDMQQDAKGFSLFSLPQVSHEFWDLYKTHFHECHVQGSLRICFYGPTSIAEYEKALKQDV